MDTLTTEGPTSRVADGPTLLPSGSGALYPSLFTLIITFFYCNKIWYIPMDFIKFFVMNLVHDKWNIVAPSILFYIFQFYFFDDF